MWYGKAESDDLITRLGIGTLRSRVVWGLGYGMAARTNYTQLQSSGLHRNQHTLNFIRVVGESLGVSTGNSCEQ